MLEQKINGYTVKILSADELGGYPMTGKSDMGIAEVYDRNDEIVDRAWITISKNGRLRFERVV